MWHVWMTWTFDISCAFNFDWTWDFSQLVQTSSMSFDIHVSHCEEWNRLKQRFLHVFNTTCQILQSVRRSIEVRYGTGSVRMSAVVPRRNTLGSRDKTWQDGNCEPADGKSVLAALVKLNAVAQWHSRWECPWTKHDETAGTGGNENMKGVGIVWVGTRDVYASKFWTHE